MSHRSLPSMRAAPADGRAMRCLAAIAIVTALAGCGQWPASRGGGLEGTRSACPETGLPELHRELGALRVRATALDEAGLGACRPALSDEIARRLLRGQRAGAAGIAPALAADVHELRDLLDTGERSLVVMQGTGCAASGGAAVPLSRWPRLSLPEPQRSSPCVR